MWASVYRQWRNWSLLNRLGALGAISGILVLVITTATFVLDITELFFASNRDAPTIDQEPVEPISLVVEFENKYKNAVVLAGRGEAMFWYPGAGGQHEIGKFDLVDSSGASLTELRLDPREKRRVVASFYPVERVAALLQQGHTDLSLFIRGKGIDSTLSPHITFKADNISAKYLPIELAPDKD